MCKKADLEKVMKKSNKVIFHMLDLLHSVKQADLCPDVKEKIESMLDRPMQELTIFDLNINLSLALMEDDEEHERRARRSHLN